jgi:secreted trypsin-like serine protease
MNNNKKFAFITAVILFIGTISQSGATAQETELDIVSSFVVNGKAVPNISEFPFQVGLVKFEGSNFEDGAWSEQICGGTAISATWILTAAHCFNNTSNIGVIGGKLDLDEYRSDDVVSPIRIVIHPSYVTESDLNDIALIELPQLPTGVSAIGSFGDVANETADTPVSVIGWGNTQNGLDDVLGYPTELRFASLEISTQTECDIWADLNPTSYDASSQICASGIAETEDAVVGFTDFTEINASTVTEFREYIVELDSESGDCWNADPSGCFLSTSAGLPESEVDKLPFDNTDEVIGGYTAGEWEAFFQSQVDYIEARDAELNSYFGLSEVSPETFYATSCFGDSGGPVVTLDGSSLIGVVSYGLYSCTGPAPSVYSKVSFFIPWINSVLNPTSDVPESSGGGGGGSTATSLTQQQNNQTPTSSRELSIIGSKIKVNLPSNVGGRTVRIYNNQKDKTVFVGFGRLNRTGNLTITSNQTIKPGSLFVMLGKKIIKVITVN